MPGPAPTMPTIPAPMQPTIPGPEEPQTCEGFMYTIRAGDTLYMLSRTYRVNLDTLMRANPNLDPYNLRIGMQICIPVSNNTTGSSQAEQTSATDENNEEKHETRKIYKTQKGDTLTRILDRYEITFAALQNSNPDVDFTGNLENISLNIPSKDPFRTCPMSGAYIVKSGDNLDSISKKLLVLSDSLLMANPVLTIDDFSIPDTKICIPDQ
jgi:LysM repeat protein